MKTFIPSYKDYFDKLRDFNAEDTCYDEVDIKDFKFDTTSKIFTYPCPCGDLFEIHLDDLLNYEEIARCPSCSLIVRVIYDDLSEFL